MKDQFENHILPLLKRRKPKKILELGVLDGGATIQLLRYCEENDANLISVEPIEWQGNIPNDLKKSFTDFSSDVLKDKIYPKYVEEIFKLNLDKNWRCLKKTSNSYLNSKEFDGFDLCLWDADHNYFNLLRDLKDLHMKSKIGDQILIQGIEKWNRKDQYANSKNIPLEFYFGKKQGLKKAIKDFLKITSNRRYFRTIPFLYFTKKKWKYKNLTMDKHGLGLLEKIKK